MDDSVISKITNAHRSSPHVLLFDADYFTITFLVVPSLWRMMLMPFWG